MSDVPQVVLKPRSQAVADLIDQCARGELKFSGPDSLYSKVYAMGFNCNSLFEMVVAREWELKNEG